MKALQIIDKGRNICWFMCKRTKNSKNYNHLKSVLGKNRMWKCLQKRKSCSVTSKKDWCWSWISSILSSDMNSWFIGKVSDAGKDWGQKEKRVSEDEIVGWMASLMQWAWIWANFGWWWGTGRPSMLQSMKSQRVKCDCGTDHNRTQRSGNVSSCFGF